MAQGEKKKMQSSNHVEIENDDEKVKSNFDDAQEIPVSKTPMNISSTYFTGIDDLLSDIVKKDTPKSTIRNVFCV